MYLLDQIYKFNRNSLSMLDWNSMYQTESALNLNSISISCRGSGHYLHIAVNYFLFHVSRFPAEKQLCGGRVRGLDGDEGCPGGGQPRLLPGQD
jgi:hypothetical protein